MRIGHGQAGNGGNVGGVHQGCEVRRRRWAAQVRQFGWQDLKPYVKKLFPEVLRSIPSCEPSSASVHN